MFIRCLRQTLVKSQPFLNPVAAMSNCGRFEVCRVALCCCCVFSLPLHCKAKTTKSTPLNWWKFIWRISGFNNRWVVTQKWIPKLFCFSPLHHTFTWSDSYSEGPFIHLISIFGSQVRKQLRACEISVFFVFVFFFPPTGVKAQPITAHFLPSRQTELIASWWTAWSTLHSGRTTHGPIRIQTLLLLLWQQNLYEMKKENWRNEFHSVFSPFTFIHCCSDIMNENILWIFLVLHAN